MKQFFVFIIRFDLTNSTNISFDSIFLESELIQNKRKIVFLYALQHFIPRKQQMYDLEI